MTVYRTKAIILFCLMMLTGCAVGPDFKSPEPPQTQAYTAVALPRSTAAAAVDCGNAQCFEPGGDIPAQWWQLFRSEALDRLIRMGLNDNPSVAAARAALRRARENMRAQSGTTWFPQLDLGLSATRQRTNYAGFGSLAGGATTFNLYNASVNVSYFLDFFGSARRELEALGARVDYQAYQARATYLSLAANIVTAAIQEASLRAQLQATREILADQQQSYTMMQRQYDLGGISSVDLLAQKTQLVQTRATLPPLEKALSQTRHLLAVLLGKYPSEARTLPEFDIQGLALPAELPVSLPSTLARQRPDIQAAEALLHEACAQVGVATANLYPQVTLTGEYGTLASKTSALFQSDSMIWNIGGGLMQPLFHGGALRAKRRSAMAAYDQAAANYRETLLQAFLNVADVLRALEADARTLKARFEAESAARDTLDLTKKQLQAGAVSYLSLLDAQRRYQQSRIRLIQARADRLSDTAALFQALGGGWPPPPVVMQNDAGPVKEN